MLGIAVVGAGSIGGEHARALAGEARARLALVCDVAAGRARELARRYGARWTAAPAEVWSSPDVDAVVVATPSDTHHALTLAAARAGKHVLVEKPAALSPAELIEMQSACREAGVVLLVGQTLRFTELGQALRAAVGADDVGGPAYCALVTHTARPWPGGWRGWQTKAARSGGMALHLGVHGLDLALWLLGSPPARVYAQGANLAAPGLDVCDYLHILVRCESGANALIEVNASLPGRGNAYQSALLIGTRGQAQWSLADDGLLLADGGARLLFEGYARAQRAELAHFVDCCLAVAEPLVTPEQARWALAAALAANRSIERGEPVDVAEVTP